MEQYFTGPNAESVAKAIQMMRWLSVRLEVKKKTPPKTEDSIFHGIHVLPSVVMDQFVCLPSSTTKTLHTGKYKSSHHEEDMMAVHIL